MIKLEEKKKQLYARLDVNERFDEVKQKVDEVVSYSKLETLTEEVKEALIEKVFVYEDHRIEIGWKYQDEYDKLLI